ncbi:hypothetical protein [Variovorax sp. OV329]|uniref:hypothetical protein n=1 Tax=Variovorax sp. OV329 TaxID=1882825 RepID=UPI0008E71864|nr:hypothetical protein [Variovorax sp. OV329]SFL96500.1 hypothetical protein SAMN05444747_101491 [Variovorax sp. OV329]
MPRLVLHIDRLVLHGVERADAAGVADALQEQLGALLAAGGSPLAAQGNTHALQAGRIRLPHDAGAAALGHAVATRIAGDPAAGTGTTKGAPP